MAVEYQPLIIGFLCNWCSYAGADMAGTSRIAYPPNIRIIRVPCSGRVDPLFVVKCFQLGADGVLIAGCHPGDCHYSEGNYHARRRFALLRPFLDYLGIEAERFRVEWVSASEGKRFSQIVSDFTQKLLQLGPRDKTPGAAVGRRGQLDSANSR
jgi:coenzyme F420-reducing hydrogenase delta subunit